MPRVKYYSFRPREATDRPLTTAQKGWKIPSKPITSFCTNVKDALHEVKLSLTLTSGVTLFDSSGVTTQEFSDNVVEAIAENCSKKFFAC